MNRLEVIQALLSHLGDRRSRQGLTYLEIGVKRGATFLAVRASRKIAVDPAPRISRRARWKACFRDPSNLRNRYFPVESDRFFGSPPEGLTRRGLDVAFIDGLHTHEQSLRDVHHCLAWLRPGGALVLHDCNPVTETAALPLSELPEGDPSNLQEGWSGDVWKTVVHLRATEPGLRVWVLDCDCGLGVVYPADSADSRAVSGLSPDRISELAYADLAARRKELLNLRPAGGLPDILEDLERQAWR